MDILTTCRSLILLQIIIPEIVGTSLNQSNSYTGSYTPIFEKKLVEKDRKDGYWIEAFQLSNNSSIGLVAYGLGQGEIKYYQNLSANQEPSKGILIQKLDVPVGMGQVDLTGDGFNDIIISYQFGRNLIQIDPDGGKIVWLENPGRIRDNDPWKSYYVGKSTSMHRLNVGHFTQKERWEIIGLPIVSKPYDVFSPVPVLLFRQPDNLRNATEWHREIINAEFFSVIHDAIRINYTHLDSLIIASSEGINWLYYDQALNKWAIKHIGDGDTSQKQQIGFYGTGGMDICRVKNDSFAYMPAIEPFHGNVVAAYVKNTNSSLQESQWTRYLLDIFGHANENGESSSHHVVCVDFDQDGDDEFLVSYRGPPPYQGVFYYKPIDISRGLFAKWNVDNGSVGRIAIADFDNDNMLDFASISYDVVGFQEDSNPSINVFYNRLAQKQLGPEKVIKVMKQNSTLVFKVPRPQKILEYEELPFITINGIALSLTIIPPHSSRMVNNNTYVKVLYGTIMWSDSGKGSQQLVKYSRQPFIEPKTTAPLEIRSDNDRISTGDDGALLIIFQKLANMTSNQIVEDLKKLIIENSLPDYSPEDARQLRFQFDRYDKFDPSPQYKDLELYYMKGVRIYFIENDEHLCDIKFGAAGQGVNGGVQNHAADTFCEIHVCLINGSSKGGIYYLSSSKETYNPLTTPDSAFKQLILPKFYEDGPLWDIDAQKRPVIRSNGTVVYPWHKWQAGINPSLNQSFDLWAVFEFNNKFSALPFTSSSEQRSIPSIFNILFALLILTSISKCYVN